MLKDAQQKVIQEIQGTTIGRKRMLTFPTVQASSVSFLIKDQHDVTTIGEIGVYKIDDALIEKK